MAELTSEPTTDTQGQSAGASSPTTSNDSANVENPTTETNANVNEDAPANGNATTTGTDTAHANGLGSNSAASQDANYDGLANQVSADLTKQLHELETRLDATIGESEGRLSTAYTSGTEGLDVQGLTTDEVLQYVPADAPQYVASYMTPVLWGIAAGLVAFLIGYVWDAARRLLGLAGKK